MLRAEKQEHEDSGRAFYRSWCVGCAALGLHGKAAKPHNDECRERESERSLRTLTGKARMNAYKDRIAETERVKEEKSSSRARCKRCALRTREQS